MLGCRAARFASPHRVGDGAGDRRAGRRPGSDGAHGRGHGIRADHAGRPQLAQRRPGGRDAQHRRRRDAGRNHDQKRGGGPSRGRRARPPASFGRQGRSRQAGRPVHARRGRPQPRLSGARRARRLRRSPAPAARSANAFAGAIGRGRSSPAGRRSRRCTRPASTWRGPTTAATAAPNTRAGTLIYWCDRFGVHPCGEDAPAAFEAAWGRDGAICVARPRIADIVSLEQLAERYPRLKPHLGPATCSEDSAMRDPAALLFNRSGA